MGPTEEKKMELQTKVVDSQDAASKIREIAARIKELREVSGTPVADIAKRMGMSVAEYERILFNNL